jgi:hypothetical protein
MSQNKENAEQRRKFIEDGMITYFDVCRAMHLFQTETAKDARDVLEGGLKRIKTAMKLEKELSEVQQSNWPDFPEEDWSYDECDVSASVWLDKPQFATLYLGVRFSKGKGNKPVNTIFCAGEVGPQHRWKKWQEIFRGHQDYLDEKWNNYAVGLCRLYLPSSDLKQELAILFKDFLHCIENNKL